MIKGETEEQRCSRKNSGMLPKRVDEKMLVRIQPNPRKNRTIGRFDKLLRTMQHYCMNSSVHGLRYIVDPKLHIFERFLWLVIFTFCSIVAGHFMYFFTCKIQEAPTSIAIESMNHRISALPFPSITLCPNDRVDWNKVLQLEERIFPNSTDPDTRQTFRDALAQLSIISFGDFHRLAFLKDRSLDGLKDVNVTDVLLQVAPNCEQLFSGCWWRNSNRNCCEIFELHKTEYGFCYSFNSNLAEDSHRRKRQQLQEERPRRATSYGVWSGVKVTISLTSVRRPPNSEDVEGVIFIMKDPRTWPSGGRMIPPNSVVSMSFNCVSGYATQAVLDLDDSKAPCRYKPDNRYTQDTCISRCKRMHVIKHCGCNPSFLFPSNENRACNVQDLLCLVKHNNLYKDYELADKDNLMDKSAIICNCPPGCEYYIYTTQVAAVHEYQSRDITLDVHFASQTNFRYKTDLIYTYLNFLVSFGSIIGLFLGGSLLSAVELIYYLMLVLLAYLRCCWTLRKRRIHRRRSRNASQRSSRLFHLPVLDYGPVKVGSSGIPISVNYTAVKSNSNRY